MAKSHSVSLPLRSGTDSPETLLESARNLLRSTALYVLDEVGAPPTFSASEEALWYSACEVLGILPQQVDPTLPGADSIRAILQHCREVAGTVDTLVGVSGSWEPDSLRKEAGEELARMIVHEACIMAEFLLATLEGNSMPRTSRADD